MNSLKLHVFPAMVISRAHMESAAFAAYAEDNLVECNQNSNWERMKTRLRSKTSLTGQPKNLSIMEAIDAMDRFAECAGARVTKRFRVQ